ncbi:MAG: indolepyruvate ferredoxin oxidoreductase subunit beta [Promethearchaeota archaeon]|nr:MAG: indolepyruvate ferredoxin oxidoreductase subunit beta [Candidatus Lokiarchaeota archaeon]
MDFQNPPINKLISMEIDRFNTFTIGVGGQGVIRATHILADAALAEDHHVRTAETHGMAQRGGSVSGYLRFGKEVHGPLIPKQGAHIIISLEPSEALRSLNYADKNTYYFINTTKIMPLSIYQDRKLKYPTIEEIRTELSKITSHVHFIDATKLAEQAGNIKTMNVVLLGMVLGSGKMPLLRETLENSIKKFVPAKALDVNRRAFELGFQQGKKTEEI